MAQIIGGAAKPKRCNKNQLSQLGTPAAGEHILVSSDNSMNAAGQGNFDCYIEGTGTTAATALPLKTIASEDFDILTQNAVTGSGVAKKFSAQECVNPYKYTINQKYITSSNAWATGSSTYNLSINIQVRAGEKYRIVSRSSYGAIYAFLKSDTSVGTSVDFSSEINHRVSLTAGEIKDIVIPSDTTLLYVFINTQSNIYIPKIYQYEDVVNDILPLDNHNIDVFSAQINNKYINASNIWTNSSSSTGKQKSIYVPVQAGETYKISGNASRQAIYAFLKSDTSVGADVDFSGYITGRQTIAAGQSVVVTIPADTTLLYMYKNDDIDCYLPSLEKYGEINIIEDEIKEINLSLSTIFPTNVPLGVYTINQKYINASNQWAAGSASSNWSINVPVQAGETYKITSNANHGAIYALLKSDTSVGTDVDFSSELTRRVVLNANEVAYVTIPTDTTLLYLFRNTTTSEIFLPTELALCGEIQELENEINKSNYKTYLRGCMMGDSIAYGVYSYWNGNARYNGVKVENGISDYIGKILGISFDNLAKRGTGFVADTRNVNNAWEQAQVTDYADYDLVVMMYGVNDYIQASSLGSLAENAEGTVAGNMTRVFNKILTDNPYCKVICIGSYNTWGQVSEGGDYTAEHYYGDASTDYALGFQISGHTLQDYFDLQKEVCDAYHIEYYCLANASFVNSLNLKNILVDGLHPTLESRKYIAREIAKNL